jgi:hypothetical protein
VMNNQIIFRVQDPVNEADFFDTVEDVEEK